MNFKENVQYLTHSGHLEGSTLLKKNSCFCQKNHTRPPPPPLLDPERGLKAAPLQIQSVKVELVPKTTLCPIKMFLGESVCGRQRERERERERETELIFNEINQ